MNAQQEVKMSEKVKRVCANTLTGLIDLAHEQRHTLVNQGFPDNDEGDAFSRVRDSRVARIDRIIEAARAAPDDDYDALHAEAEANAKSASYYMDAFADAKADAEALRAENGRLREERDSFQREGIRAMEELEAARGLLESAVVLFACHCTDATAKNWHDAAAAFLTATPAPEVRQEPAALPDSEFVNEFMDWWEKHGQYVRSGGGDYERTFAFEAWRYLMPKLHAALAEQGERQEAVATINVSVALRELAEQFKEAWPDHQGKYDFLIGAGARIAAQSFQQPGPDVRALVEALEWHEQKAAGCRKLTSEGDECRQALDSDGGKRAHTAIAATGLELKVK